MTEDTQAVETTVTEEPAEVATEPKAEPAPAPEKDLSPRDALREAAKKLGSEPPPKREEPKREAKTEKTTGPVRGPDGRFAPQEQPETPKPDDGQVLQKPVEATELPKPDAEKPSPYRAPQGWSPAAREALLKADPVVQAEAAKRERDYAVGIQQHAERAKVGDQFREVAQPYAMLFQQNGVDPITGIGQLLKTSAALNYGAPQQRAQVLANMVRNFLGTDEQAIQLLASAIDTGGGSSPQGPQQVNPNAIAQQVREQIFGELARARQQTAIQRASEQRAKLIEQFGHASGGFFEDVEPDVADILELATRRGKSITPEEAYNRAVMLHPEISKIFQQREAAKAAATARAATQRTEVAASSLRSQPAANPGGKIGQALSRQDAIRRAAADVAGRGRV